MQQRRLVRIRYVVSECRMMVVIMVLTDDSIPKKMNNVILNESEGSGSVKTLVGYYNL